VVLDMVFLVSDDVCVREWPLAATCDFELFEKFEFPPTGGLNIRESDLVKV